MNIIKHQTCIEVTRGDKKFLFYMDNDATWGTALDAAFEVIEEIQKYSQKAVEAMKPKIEREAIDLTMEGGE